MGKVLHGFLVVVLGMAALLGGCLFIRIPKLEGPALVFSDLIGPIGGEGELTIEVVDLPGVAGVSILGFRYNPTKFKVTTIEGLNGFHLLCNQIDSTNGELRFILVNPAGEICTGTIARIGGEWLARGDPEFAIERVEVVDEANALLPSGSYAIRLGRAPSITPAKPIKQEKLCAGLRLRL